MSLWYLCLDRAPSRALCWLRLSAAVALFVVLSQPQAAVADCGRPPFALLWSYPANGDTNVPTNALLWTLSSDWSRPMATLDGVPLPLPVDGAGGVPLGALTPQRDYLVQLSYPDPYLRADAGPSVIELRFRTGDGPATQLPAVPVSGFSRARGRAASPCPDVVEAQDCHDMGQDTLFTFDVTEPRAIGFQVDDYIWPARCGQPSIFVRDGWTKPCVEVRVIGTGGLRSEPTRHCLDARATAAFSGLPQDAATAPTSPAQTTPGTTTPTEGGAATGQSANEGACSVRPSARSFGTLGWLLFSVVAVLLARASRRTPRA